MGDDSLDAALTLVPDGWYWEMGCHTNPGEMFVALIRGPYDHIRPEGQYFVGHANTPAQAMRIAATKAAEMEAGG